MIVKNHHITAFTSSEACSMRRYSHANIVKIVGVSATQSTIMLCMELMPSKFEFYKLWLFFHVNNWIVDGSLDQYLHTYGKEASAVLRVRFCLDAVKGMEYLSESKCIHRWSCLLLFLFHYRVSTLDHLLNRTTFSK